MPSRSADDGAADAGDDCDYRHGLQPGGDGTGTDTRADPGEGEKERTGTRAPGGMDPTRAQAHRTAEGAVAVPPDSDANARPDAWPPGEAMVGRSSDAAVAGASEEPCEDARRRPGPPRPADGATAGRGTASPSPGPQGMSKPGRGRDRD